MEPKHYYLPPYRSITAGAILIVVGIAFSFIGVDFQESLWRNLQQVFISFESLGDFFFSLFMLLFKAGFIVAGYFYIRYADGVERARLDDKGFYYREIPKGSGMSKMSIDLGALSFAPYHTIRDLTYKKTFWSGGQLVLTLDAGVIPLVALGVLKDKDKQEIAELVKARLTLK
jgi:hypothetical protein